MAFWETADRLPDLRPFIRDYTEIWKAADTVVYSTTLETVSTAKTRLEREFDPQSVRHMKAQADRHITVGGPDLAAQAIKAGLVDEYHLFLTPVLVGGGKHALPKGVRLDLELVDERPFQRRRGSSPLSDEDLSATESPPRPASD